MTIRGKGEVLITVDGAPLDWRSSLAVTDEATAERFYQRFKWDVIIAPIEADRWALDATGVLSWLESAAAGTNDVLRLAVEER